jgi:parvulin-like peptidyl-prolyl isomerase
MNLKRVLREPLVHFLAAGGVVFLIFSMLPHAGTDPSSDKTITVNKESLLNFLQYRSKAFQPEYFTTQLEAMSPAEREALVQQYVEEEILYREAVSLGLDQGDYVIRQRLVQKMRFLIDDLGDIQTSPKDAALDAYLKKNEEIYTIAPSVTFTHVFVDASIHGDKASNEKAQRLSEELNARGAGFNDAPRYGDRFPFLQNYVERTFDYVSSHFGPEFAASLRSLAPSKRWSAPLRSMYGYHLVLLTDRAGGRLPELDEIREQVEEDWLRDRMERVRSTSLKRIAEQYTIEREDIDGEGSK